METLRGGSRSVFFVTQTASLHGGVERWLDDLVSGLADQGWHVVLGLADGARFHHAEHYLQAWPRLAALPHHILRAPSGLAWERRQAIERALAELRPDVVVPVMLHDVLAACSNRRAAGQRLRLVYPIHENESWSFEAVAANIRMLDAVVSVNRLMLDALHELAGWPAERSFHVPHGVLAGTAAGPRFQADEPVRVGYCGKLTETPKRAGDLVGFCQRLEELGRRFTVTIAGTGPEEGALRRDLAPWLADGRARFMGWLDARSLDERFYPDLDVLLITSEREAGPLVAWEGLAHGRLVLTSRYQGLLREGVLRHGESALVYPVGKPNLAAEMLHRQLEDPPALAAIAERGRAVARERLLLERTVAAWSSALDRALEQFVEDDGSRPQLAPGPGPGERLEASLRRWLGRPVRTGSAHEEWPRFRPGVVSAKAREAFTRDLSELETRLCSGNSESRPLG